MTARRRKGPGGRPPKPASEKQANRILLSLTDTERVALAKVAEDETLAGYVRRLVLRHLRRLGALEGRRGS